MNDQDNPQSAEQVRWREEAEARRRDADDMAVLIDRLRDVATIVGACADTAQPNTHTFSIRPDHLDAGSPPRAVLLGLEQLEYAANAMLQRLRLARARADYEGALAAADEAREQLGKLGVNLLGGPHLAQQDRAPTQGEAIPEVRDQANRLNRERKGSR